MLPSVLLPINCGENKILEGHADAIIVACSGGSEWVGKPVVSTKDDSDQHG